MDPCIRGGEGGNDLAANAIRFTNRSNIKVAFTVNFKASEDYSGLKMKFLENGTAPTLHSAESGTAPSYTLLVTMEGALNRSVTEAVPWEHCGRHLSLNRREQPPSVCVP